MIFSKQCSTFRKSWTQFQETLDSRSGIFRSGCGNTRLSTSSTVIVLIPHPRTVGLFNINIERSGQGYLTSDSMKALWTIIRYLLRCMQVYAIVTIFVNFVWYCCINSTFLFVTVLGIQYALYILPQPRITDLTKKAVLITGCDTGIGNELAKRLDSLGFRVFAGCLKVQSV